MSWKPIKRVIHILNERGYKTQMRYEQENSPKGRSRWIYTITMSKETESRILYRMIAVQSVNYPRFQKNTVMAFTTDSSIERIVDTACFESSGFPSGPWDYHFPKAS